MKEKQEKYGRWTDEEHDLFLEGLVKFGRDWVAVAQLVKTRSTTQVRSHAQKHFLKDSAPKRPQGSGNDDGIKRPRLIVPIIADLRRSIPALGGSLSTSSASASNNSSSSTSAESTPNSNEADAHSTDDGSAADALRSLRCLASAATEATDMPCTAMPPPRPVQLDQIHVPPEESRSDDAFPPPPAVNPRLKASCSSISVVDDATFKALAE